MKKSLLLSLILLLVLGKSLAQDWVQTDSGAASYNCTLIGALSAEFGGYDIARVDGGYYTPIEFFQVVVSDCLFEGDVASASPDHKPDWKKSAVHQTEYDCSLLQAMHVEYGEETMVRGEGDITYSLREFFASLVPDCAPEVDIDELISRIETTEGWVKGSNESYEFNCGYVSAAVAEYGDLPIFRSDDGIMSLREFFRQSAPLCSAREDLPAKPASAHPNDYDWVQYRPGKESACATVKLLLDEYGAHDFLRSGDANWTVFSYHQDISPNCVPLAVLARKGAVLRSCPEEACEIAVALDRDMTLPVTGLYESGYQVEYRDRTWFVASSSDVIAHDEIVVPNDGINIDEFDCFFSPTASTSRSDDVKIIDLSPPDETTITLYRPLDFLGVYFVEFLRNGASLYIAVPASYPANYEFLVKCE